MDEMAPDGGRNVCFVVLDTVRKDHLTPYGYDRETTPELKSFAEEAVVYEEAVAQAPWTLPVHASMFTGRYPSEHGATQETPYLAPGTVTLAEILGTTGYATACYSSNAWITPYTRLTRGFDAQDNFFEVLPGDVFSGMLAEGWQKLNDVDRLRGIANRLVEVGNDIHEYFAGSSGADSKTPAIVDRVADFAETQDRWFVFANLMDAHLPYYPPDRYRETFAPGVDPDSVCQNSKEYNSGARDIDDEEWQEIEGLYDAEIAHADAELGRLFDRLKSAGEWDETVIVVCADHGELHGEHGLYGHEFSVAEPLVNVPLMIKHPDLEPGRSSRPLELLDLYDTVLESAGATDVPADLGARPFQPERSLLSTPGRDFENGDVCFIEYHRPVVELRQLETKAQAAGIELDRDSRFYSRMRAGRRPDAKYVRNERIPDEAYRLDTDSGETTSIDVEEDPAVSEVLAALERFEREVTGKFDDAGQVRGDESDGAEPLEGMDEATKDRLRELGYLE